MNNFTTKVKTFIKSVIMGTVLEIHFYTSFRCIRDFYEIIFIFKEFLDKSAVSLFTHS